jgi:RimJ/RimL family protein N-acetyltransferase
MGRPIDAVETSRLKIIPFEKSFLSRRYVGWLNDPEVVRYSEQRHREHSLESCGQYFQFIQNNPHGFLAIVAKDSGTHIGNSTIVVDPNNQLADISIMIGDRKHWGKGLGSEAFCALVHHLLATGQFHKITAGTMAANTKMLKLFEKAGMTIECRRKRHYLLDGKPVDMIYAAKWENEKKL